MYIYIMYIMYVNVSPDLIALTHEIHWIYLIHCGLVTAYGHIDQGQH